MFGTSHNLYPSFHRYYVILKYLQTVSFCIPPGTSNSSSTWSLTSSFNYFISIPYLHFSFFLHHLPRHLKLKCYRNSKCFFLFYISHLSWIRAVFNFKSISNPLCPLHPSGYCCSAILMRFWCDHCNNFLRGFHMSSLAHSILFSVLLPDDYML